MATEWNPETAYAPGAVVSYNGIVYVRSQYPALETYGTPPNEELNTDPNGDEIRSWYIYDPLIPGYQPNFHTCYFRIIDAPFNGTDLFQEFDYAGASNYQENAYGPLYPQNQNYVEPLGYSVEYDQFRDNSGLIPPRPNSPQCPADKCGVALQQYKALNVNFDTPGPYDIADGAHRGASVGRASDQPLDDKKIYVWLGFDHPLYFRRQFSIVTRYTEIDVLTGERTYVNGTVSVTPTDQNYQHSIYQYDYFTIANSVGSFSIPEDTATTVYSGPTYGSGFIADVESNW